MLLLLVPNFVIFLLVDLYIMVLVLALALALALLNGQHHDLLQEIVNSNRVSPPRRDAASCPSTGPGPDTIPLN